MCIRHRLIPVEHVGGLRHVLKFVEARRLVDSQGRSYTRIFTEFNKRVINDQIREVRIDEACRFFMRPTRTYSGIAKFPPIPPPDTARFLNAELLAGVRRSHMGKSVFDMQGKLYRLVYQRDCKIKWETG